MNWFFKINAVRPVFFPSPTTSNQIIMALYFPGKCLPSMLMPLMGRISYATERGVGLPGVQASRAYRVPMDIQRFSCGARERMVDASNNDDSMTIVHGVRGDMNISSNSPRPSASISKVRQTEEEQFTCKINADSPLKRTKTESESKKIEDASEQVRQFGDGNAIDNNMLNHSSIHNPIQRQKGRWIRGSSLGRLSAFTRAQLSYCRQISGSSNLSYITYCGNLELLTAAPVNAQQGTLHTLSRAFRTCTCLFDKDGKSDTSTGPDPEDAEVEEWIHPDRRSDSILDSDPELKSMLRDLASDFGRDEHGDDPASSTSAQTDPVLSEEDGLGEGRGEDGEKVIVRGGTDIAFEPVRGESDTEKMPEKRFVFSIDDLAAILREENARDICVIRIPKEKQYVDFFVVVTARSPRHLRAMTLHINQQYKAKKTKEDPFVLVEGEQTDDWMCIDFGNIVLHLMSEETREFYELEKLWTLGPQYDDQLRRLKEYDEKMKDVIAMETSSPSEHESGEKDESHMPTITFGR